MGVPVATNNITLKVLNSIFEDIATNHALINAYGLGDPWEITAETVQYYPLFWVEVLPGTFGSNLITYNFRLMVCDLVHKDESNELDVQSDTIQVLWDIVKLLKDNYEDFFFDLSTSNTATPFTEEFDDEVTGWYLDISITVPRIFGSCDVPTKPQELSGLYIFYGVKADNSEFSDTDTIINSTKYPIDSTDITSDISVDWTPFNSSPQYCWVAIPYTESSQIKNHWYVNTINQGNIGSSELFSIVQTVTINGVNYSVFITNYQTQFNDVCLMQKV